MIVYLFENVKFLTCKHLLFVHAIYITVASAFLFASSFRSQTEK